MCRRGREAPGRRGSACNLFDVSTGYLLIDGVPRRRFADTGDELTERIGMASRLSATDKAAIVHIIDGLLANSRIPGRPRRGPVAAGQARQARSRLKAPSAKPAPISPSLGACSASPGAACSSRSTLFGSSSS
jgi:hypothetical protein